MSMSSGKVWVSPLRWTSMSHMLPVNPLTTMLDGYREDTPESGMGIGAGAEGGQQDHHAGARRQAARLTGFRAAAHVFAALCCEKRPADLPLERPVIPDAQTREKAPQAGGHTREGRPGARRGLRRL